MAVTVRMIGLDDCEQCLASTATGAGLQDLCLFVAHTGREDILLGDCVMNEMAPRFHAWGVFSGQVMLGHIIVIPECESCVQSHVIFLETEVWVCVFPFCCCKFSECQVQGPDFFRLIAFATWG